MDRPHRANWVIWSTVVAGGAMLCAAACGGKATATATPAAPIEIKPMPMEPAPATVKAVIESEPARASVFMDGDLVGQTPLELALPASAPREIKVVLEGYVEKVLTVTPEAGKLLVLQVRLAAR